jgi:hypothetical protein
VLIQLCIWPSGVGVENLIDATSNSIFPDRCCPAATQHSTKNAQIVHGFMPPEYAKRQDKPRTVPNRPLLRGAAQEELRDALLAGEVGNIDGSRGDAVL